MSGTTSGGETLNLLERLDLRAYDRKETIATIQGQHLAKALGLPLLRICAVRGIRHTPGFAEELYGLDPLFTRAINARKIMSNVIPDIRSDNEIPYCIWYPDIASEDTYRRLAQRYPSMVYQVGRACAVAGYTQLYSELDILPDTHIAEEAREAGSVAIYESIMAHSVLYSVMNDYDRRISPGNAQPAQLNADTATRGSLLVKQGFKSPDIESEDESWINVLPVSDGFHEQRFNITEDENIDVASTDEEDMPKPDTTWIDLLSNPLPTHLPTMNKDQLIRWAAYNGDIDRYVRLKRPQVITGEQHCCVHGIYHNTGFAVWWQRQQPRTDRLRAAIAARYIMNNVLIDDMLDARPYLIWYPNIAKESTYAELGRRQPWMLPQVLRACIVGGYESTFLKLVAGLHSVDKGLYGEARSSSNAVFKQTLDDILAGGDLAELTYLSRFKEEGTKSVQRSSNTLHSNMADYLSVHGGWPNLYDGAEFDTSELELYMCLPPAWLTLYPPEDDDTYEWQLDYRTTA